jgi:hypothetical protein
MRVPSGTVNVRRSNVPTSDGLSIRYWRLGAVNVNSSAPGKSWVATRQLLPAGGSNRTSIGWRSRPTAHRMTAGMLMCACVESTDR